MKKSHMLKIGVLTVVLMLSITCIVALNVGVFASQTSLLVDGNFENALVDGSGAGYDHTTINKGSWVNVCWAELFDGQKTQGNTSLKLTYSWQGECTSANFPGVYQDVDVQPNSTYAFTFKAKADNDNKTILNVGFRNPNGSDVWANVQNFVVGENIVTTEFDTYTYYFETGSLSTIRVYFYTQGVGATDYRAFYIDEASLVKTEVSNSLVADGGFEGAMVAGDAVGYDHTTINKGSWVNVCWCEPIDFEYMQGTKSMKICYSWESLCTANDYPGIYQDIDVTPNSIYKLAFFAKVDNVNKNQLKVGYRNPNGNDVWTSVEEYVVETNQIDGVFQRYEYEINVGDLNQIRLFFFAQGQGASDYRAFYVDQVTLQYDREGEKPQEEVVSHNGVVRGEVQPLVTDGNNLLVNAEFEQYFDKGDAMLLNYQWVSIFGGYDGQNDGGLRDSNCAKITYQWEDGLNNQMVTGIFQDVNVQKNQTYQFSIYIKKWWASAPDNVVEIGYADPKSPDKADVYQANILGEHITNGWCKYTIYFNTGKLDCIRLFVRAHGQSGNNGGGFNLDNSSLQLVTAPTEHVAFANTIVVSSDSPYVFIGNDTNKITASKLFDFAYRQQLSHDEVTFTVADPTIAEIKNGVIVGKKVGKTIITAQYILDGTTYTGQTEVTVRSAGETKLEVVYLYNTLDIGTEQKFYVELLDGNDRVIPTTDYSFNVVSSDQSVVMIYTVGSIYNMYGVSKGEATITVTANYLGEMLTKQITMSVQGTDLLVDGSFEFFNELNPLGKGWSLQTDCGAGIDQGVDNNLALSGKGNVWCMAPVYWDETIPVEGSVKLYQDVVVTDAGEYTFQVFINRFYAEKIGNVTLQGFGGDVFLGIVPLDSDGNELTTEYTKYGIDVGTEGYQAITCTRNLTAGKYRVVISVKGDEEFGLGMQFDDATLKKSNPPQSLNVTVGNGSMEVGAIQEITVEVVFADGTTLQAKDATIISLNRSVAIISNGYLVANNAGVVEIKVSYTYEGKTLTQTVQVTVGDVNTQNPESLTWLYWAIPVGVLTIAGVVVLTVFIVKKNKKGDQK